METCFLQTPEKNYLLTGSEQGLFLRTTVNGQLSRPALLCGNYSCGLSAVAYRNFLFYAYQNKEHALLVRTLSDTAPVFRLTDTPFQTYHTPQLAVFCGQLLLFYITEQQSFYYLKGQLLLNEEAPELFRLPLTGPLSAIPKVLLCPTDIGLYLSLTSYCYSYLLQIDTNFHMEEMVAKDPTLAPLRSELEKKEAAISDLAKLLAEKESTINDLTKQLTETQKAHQNTTKLLDRAKNQYAELMQVAERYRDEAKKWYEKCTGFSV